MTAVMATLAFFARCDEAVVEGLHIEVVSGWAVRGHVEGGSHVATSASDERVSPRLPLLSARGARPTSMATEAAGHRIVFEASPPCRLDGVGCTMLKTPEQFALLDFPVHRTWWDALGAGGGLPLFLIGIPLFCDSRRPGA
jgi:hypothetical protein